jgi:hypothetical protein
MSTTVGQITESLFGRIRRELLCILLLNPERPFFLLELVALLQTGRGGVQRELASLSESGLAFRERAGSRTYYRASPDALLIRELTALLRAAADPGRLISEFITRLDDSVAFAYRSPASMDSAGRPVIELLVAGIIPAADLRIGLERVELLSGSCIREILVIPEGLGAFLIENRGASWLEPEGGFLLRGAWPEAEAAEARIPMPGQQPDLFSAMGLDWDL